MSTTDAAWDYMEAVKDRSRDTACPNTVSLDQGSLLSSRGEIGSNAKFQAPDTLNSMQYFLDSPAITDKTFLDVIIGLEANMGEIQVSILSV